MGNSTGIDHLVAGECEKLADGYVFSEGTAWDDENEYLLFTDVPNNVIYRWDREHGVEEWRRPSQNANGLSFDRQGRLLACEHLTLSVTRTDRDGTVTTLASHYQGKELNGPNDVVERSDGAVYFTDMSATRVPPWGVERPRELDFEGVFLIPAGQVGGDPVPVLEDFKAPNGLCFSPDESILYVNDSLTSEILAYDVAVDGSLSGKRLIGTIVGAGVVDADPDELPGNADGLKCDVEGNIYCTGPRGLWVFRPDGEHLGVIEAPEVIGNMAWGGPQRDVMYLCATTSVYALPMNIRGAR